MTDEKRYSGLPWAHLFGRCNFGVVALAANVFTQFVSCFRRHIGTGADFLGIRDIIRTYIYVAIVADDYTNRRSFSAL